MRSFDQRSHSYLGYSMRFSGTVNEEPREFSVAVGKAAHEKHQFRVGDVVTGTAAHVEDPDLETAQFYKASGLRIEHRVEMPTSEAPPFLGIPPTLEVYRQRGHRRLAAVTYSSKCYSCIWGCEMAVEMIIDQWNPSQRRYRRETFCYGPKSCRNYAAGPTRKVPGRKGMSWEEEGWVDEEATAHRGLDD